MPRYISTDEYMHRHTNTNTNTDTNTGIDTHAHTNTAAPLSKEERDRKVLNKTTSRTIRNISDLYDNTNSLSYKFNRILSYQDNIRKITSSIDNLTVLIARLEYLYTDDDSYLNIDNICSAQDIESNTLYISYDLENIRYEINNIDFIGMDDLEERLKDIQGLLDTMTNKVSATIDLVKTALKETDNIEDASADRIVSKDGDTILVKEKDNDGYAETEESLWDAITKTEAQDKSQDRHQDRHQDKSQKKNHKNRYHKRHKDKYQKCRCRHEYNTIDEKIPEAKSEKEDKDVVALKKIRDIIKGL